MKPNAKKDPESTFPGITWNGTGTTGQVKLGGGVAGISHQTLAGNGATVIQVEPEALHLEAQNVGISTVRFRYTSLYRVTTGDACVTRSTGGWIELHVYEPGPITLDIDVTPASLFARHGTCP